MQKQRRHLQRAIELIEQQSKTKQSFGKSFGGKVDEMDITPKTVFRVRDSEIDSGGNSIFILEDAQSRLYRVEAADIFDRQVRGVLKVTSCSDDTFAAKDHGGSTFVFRPISLLSQVEKMVAEQIPADVSWAALQDAARAHSQNVPLRPGPQAKVASAQQQQRTIRLREDVLSGLRRGNRAVREIEAQGHRIFVTDYRNLVQTYINGEVTRPQLIAGIQRIHQRSKQDSLQMQQPIVQQQAPPAQMRTLTRHHRPHNLDQAFDDRELAAAIEAYEETPYSTQPYAIPLEFQDPARMIDITGGSGTWNVDMGAGRISRETDDRIARYHDAKKNGKGV